MSKRLFVFIYIVCFAGALCAQENSARETDSLRFGAFLDSLKQHRNDQPALALADADSMIAVARRLSSPSQERLGLLYRIIVASDQFWIGEQENSLKALEELLDSDAEAFGDNEAYYQADLLNRRGNFYYQIKDVSRAKEDFEKVIFLLNKDSLDTGEKRRMASSHRYLGAIAKEEGRYEEAEGWYRFSLQFTQANRLANVYKQLGDIQGLRGYLQAAICFYTKAWELNTKGVVDGQKLGSSHRNRIIYTSRALAESYYDQKRMDSARYWLTMSESFHLPADPELPNTLLTKADWLSQNKNFEEAEAAFEQAFSSIGEKFGEQSAPHAIALRKRAESRLAQGDVQNGLKDLQKSIKDLDATQAQSELVISEQVYSEYLAAEILKQGNKENIAQLVKHSGRALEVIDGLRQSYSSDADRQSLLARGYRLYELALLGHSLRDEKADYAAIFSLMEKSKNSLLYENWLRGKAEDQADNPELLASEKDLRRQILFLEEKIGQQADDDGSLQNRLFLLRQKHQQLRDSLSKSDSWFRLANDWQPVSLQETQAKLKADDALLSYFVGDSMLFVLLIQKDKCELFSGKTLPDLTEKIDQMRRGIFQPYLPSFVKQTIPFTLEDYQAASRELYQTLLAPFAGKLPSHLIILPDGPMADLPFAALLTDGSSDSYLVQKHSISYAWSASLWAEMRARNESLDPPSKKVFAMAPAFTGGGEEDMDIRSYQRGFLGPLPFNGKEIAAIAQIFETDSLLGKKANSEAFWEKAEDYRILHLSTHGKANREDPDHSFLAFSSDNPTQEPGSERSGNQSAAEDLLYLAQLSLLRLQAEMVVLSACETGTGTTFRGEGIYSLARGFTSAGAGSLVSTLWQVNDQLTASLMQRFYEGLADGMSKDVALREAQLALIAEGESPFYWAGFTVIGDERPLRKHGFNLSWLFLLLIPLAYLFFKQKR